MSHSVGFTMKFSESLSYHIIVKRYLRDYLRRSGSIKHSDYKYPRCVEYVMGYTINDGPIQYEITPELLEEFKKIDPDKLSSMKHNLSENCQKILDKIIDKYDLVFFMTTIKDSNGNDVNPKRYTWYLRWLNKLKKADHRSVVKLIRPNTESSGNITTNLMVFIGGNEYYKIDKLGSEEKGKMNGNFVTYNNPLTSIKIYGMDKSESDTTRYGEVSYPIYSRSDSSRYHIYTENVLGTLKKAYQV